MTSPEVFSWCTERQKQEHVIEEDWESLENELAYNPQPIVLHPKSKLVVWKKPSSVMLTRLRKAGAGSLGTTSRNANFIPSDREDFELYVSRIKEAMNVIAEVTPGYFTDINSFLRAIALADNGASFRGSSSLGRFGLVWFAPRFTWHKYIWAEEIVHECVHNLIDAVGAKDPLLLGDNLDEAVYYSPLRSDSRPLGMIFHALCVISRVLNFMDRLEENGHTYDVLDERRTILKEDSKESLAQLVDQKDKMSPMGKVLLEEMIIPAIVG